MKECLFLMVFISQLSISHAEKISLVEPVIEIKNDETKKSVISKEENKEEAHLETKNHRGITSLKEPNSSQNEFKNDVSIPNFALRNAPTFSVSNPVKRTKNGAISFFDGLNRGDVLRAVIFDDILGYEKSFSPVIATITKGSLKGSILLGNATLDPITKSVLVGFDSIRPQGTKKTYRIIGQAQSENGKLGLCGDNRSQYWTYFWAEFASRAASGFSRAQIDQNKNVFGTYEIKPNVANANKNAAGEATASTAELLADKARKAPEFTSVTGPNFVKVIILNEPRRETF